MVIFLGAEDRSALRAGLSALREHGTLTLGVDLRSRSGGSTTGELHASRSPWANDDLTWIFLPVSTSAAGLDLRSADAGPADLARAGAAGEVVAPVRSGGGRHGDLTVRGVSVVGERAVQVVDFLAATVGSALHERAMVAELQEMSRALAMGLLERSAVDHATGALMAERRCSQPQALALLAARAAAAEMSLAEAAHALLRDRTTPDDG